MSKPTLKVTADFTEDFKKIVESFKHDKVLVGIPQDENARSEEGPIGNAAILFINNFGSPANNIPPRPVMEIGIHGAQEKIAEEFKKCAKASITKGLPALDIYYERVGTIASNSIKRAITSQIGIAPPSEGTLKARARNGNSSQKSLLVTGQLRNAITYVVKGKNS